MSNILELAAQYAISVVGDVEQDFYDFSEQGLNDFANAVLADSKTELQVTCDKQSKRMAELEQENQILIEELKEARAESGRFGVGA